MPRELTNAEIEVLASRPGVKRIAVENFLGSLDVTLPRSAHFRNCRADAGSYRWNLATQEAIVKGIGMAYRG